jgi:hypothetical protein
MPCFSSIGLFLIVLYEYPEKQGVAVTVTVTDNSSCNAFKHPGVNLSYLVRALRLCQ